MFMESCLVIVKDIINFRLEMFTFFRDFLIERKVRLERTEIFGYVATMFYFDKREIDTDIFALFNYLNTPRQNTSFL